jgi:hypothetical protein
MCGEPRLKVFTGAQRCSTALPWLRTTSNSKKSNYIDITAGAAYRNQRSSILFPTSANLPSSGVSSKWERERVDTIPPFFLMAIANIFIRSAAEHPTVAPGEWSHN